MQHTKCWINSISIEKQIIRIAYLSDTANSQVKWLQKILLSTKDKQKGSKMSATKLKTVKPSKSIDDIQFQEASLDIWDKKYRLKDKQDQPVDKDIQETYDR